MRPLIYVDIDEHESGIPDRLATSGCLIRSQRLDAGDYLLSAKIAVERKSSTDLVNSITSGRLACQLDRLANTYARAVLLIEGDAWEGNPRFKAPMLARLYHQIGLQPNMSCVYSPSKAWTARLIKALAVEEQRDGNADIPAPLPVAKTARNAIDVLRSLPGVGTARANLLIQRFGTLRGVLTASEAELRDAVGPEIGRRVHDVLSSM